MAKNKPKKEINKEDENIWKEEVNTLLIEKERWQAKRKELDIEIARITGVNVVLLAKIAALEAENKELRRYKPNTAPETGKSGKTTQKEEKGKEGAKGRLKIEYDGEPLSEDDIRGIAEKAKNHKPSSKELSSFLKSRQSAKNNMK